MLINDRLSTFLTQHAGEMAFVQRSHNNGPIAKPFQNPTQTSGVLGACSIKLGLNVRLLQSGLLQGNQLRRHGNGDFHRSFTPNLFKSNR